MQGAFIKKYFFAILLLTVLLLAAILLWPLLTTIVMSIVLSVLFYPLYKKILGKIKYPSIASLLTVLVFVITLCVPIAIIGTVVFNQAQDVYAWIVAHGALDGVIGRLDAFLVQTFPGIDIDLENSLAGVASGFVGGIGSIFSATLATIFSLLLTILAMFYFLKDGASWEESAGAISPLSKESNEKIISRLRLSMNGIVRGYLLVGLAQGLLMGLGLFIFGVPYAALWGVFAAIASMVPTIGTALVAVPAILFLLITGDTGAAVGMSVWAVALVGTIDNLLNPFIVGKSIDIHPMLVLFAVLGGVALMGPVGIVIGPLIISLLFALLSVAKTELYLQ